MTKWIALIFTIFCLSGCHARPTRFHNLHNHANNVLRVVTYNVNWGHDDGQKINPALTIKAILHIKAEVIILQETTKQWAKILKSKIGKLYPYQRFAYYKNGGGKAFLSKYPIVQFKTIPINGGWYPARRVLIKTPLGVIQFINVHLVPTYSPHQNPGAKKIPFYKTTSTRLKEIQEVLKRMDSKYTTIIAGDFNEGDFGKAVQYLRKSGFYDALLYVKSDTHTWRYRLGPVLLAGRYDRIFYTKTLRVIRAQVLSEGGSDHYPFAVDFIKTP